MGSIGDVFPYDVPTVGTPNYGAALVDVLDELVTRVSSPVPLEVLQGGDLELNNQGITGVKFIQFEEQPAQPDDADKGVVQYYNGEFWLVTSTGALQITESGALNVSINGGIGGDYGGGNPALVTFSDAEKLYRFYDDRNTLAWASVRAGAVDFANGLFRARVNWTGGANIAITLPATLPGSGNSVAMIDSTGVITHTASVTNDIVLDGTTKVQHGDRFRTFPIHRIANIARALSTASSTWLSHTGTILATAGAAGALSLTSSPTILECTVGGEAYERVKSFTVHYGTSSADDITLAVYRVDWTGDNLVATQTSLGVNNSSTSITATIGAPAINTTTLNIPSYFRLQITSTSGHASVYSAFYIYDVPA